MQGPAPPTPSLLMYVDTAAPRRAFPIHYRLKWFLFGVPDERCAPYGGDYTDL